MHEDPLNDDPSATAAPVREGAVEPGEPQVEPGERAEGTDGPRIKVTDRRFWAQGEGAPGDEPDRPRLPSYVEQLKHDLEEKDRQLREYIAAYKKEVGEGLEKTKQRLERDAAQRLEQLRGQLTLPLMEVLDVLERSLAAAEASPDPAALRQGVKMVHLLMVQKLAELGLTRIPAVGARFDPTRHEAAAVAAVSDPAQDNVVLLELKPGFLLGERVIRPALVQVGKLAC